MKIGICDDEEIFRTHLGEELELYKKKNGMKFEIVYFENAEEYMEQRQQGMQMDVLFLDIEMETITGIQLKNFIQKQKDKTKILFITSHLETMPEAFGPNVYGFLKKPLEREMLFKKTGELFKELEGNKIVLKDNLGKVHFVYQEDILYMKAEGRYSVVYTEMEEISMEKSLKEWEQEFQDTDFIRVHKSFLINMSKIEGISKEIKMLNGQCIPMGRSRKKLFLETYRTFMVRAAIS